MPSMRISRCTALHISYTVSAATLAAVSASISTPVSPWQRTSLRMCRAASSASNEMSTFVSSSGWHIGMSSLFFFAAMMPATCATASTSPLPMEPSRILSIVAFAMRTVAAARATR